MEQIKLKCVREGKKLRIKIISPGYIQSANCRFPRDIREENREYLVPQADITLMDTTRNLFFYSIKKRNIKIVELELDLSNLKIYGDTSELECAICMTNENEIIIFAPCGHYCSCIVCSKKLKNCPMCRTNIKQIVTKDQLQ